MTLAHLLAHHHHLLTYFRAHPRQGRHFLNLYIEYRRGMRPLLADRHYCHWLLGYLRTHHHLPGIDLLLGS